MDAISDDGVSVTEPVILRLRPGDDLRLALEDRARTANASWVLISGIGSLRVAMLRFAGAAQATRLSGPLEMLSLAGTVCGDGAHVHALVADSAGEALGGHVCTGSIVATTAELALLPLRRVHLEREHDPETGFPELVVSPKAR